MSNLSSVYAKRSAPKRFADCLIDSRSHLSTKEKRECEYDIRRFFLIIAVPSRCRKILRFVDIIFLIEMDVELSISSRQSIRLNDNWITPRTGGFDLFFPLSLSLLFVPFILIGRDIIEGGRVPKHARENIPRFRALAIGPGIRWLAINLLRRGYSSNFPPRFGFPIGWFHAGSSHSISR